MTVDSNVTRTSIWVVVSEDGNVECGPEPEDAQTRFAENVGGSEMRRMLKIELETPFDVLTVKCVVPKDGEAKLLDVKEAQRDAQATLGAGTQAAGKDALSEGGRAVAECPEHMPPFPEKYRVRWEVDSDAETPGDAAREAYDMMRNRAGLPPVFEILDNAGNRTLIDTEELGERKEGADG
jgi:hypothetical protein